MKLIFTIIILLFSVQAAFADIADIYAHVGKNVLTIKMEDNSSAQAFVDLLQGGDLTIDMHDYGNFEKVGSIGTDLPRNDKRIRTKLGDVILYQGNQITIYYDVNEWNFTLLGRVQNTAGLKEVLGNDKVTVRFSLER